MSNVGDLRIERKMGLRNQILSARNRLKRLHDKQVRDELTFKDVRCFQNDFEILTEWMKCSCRGLNADMEKYGKLDRIGGLASDEEQLRQAEEMLKVLSFHIDKLNRVQEIMREEFKI